MFFTIASLATCLVGADPVQAATAAITVTSVVRTSTYDLTVKGTVTCSVSTGTAHITVTGIQVMPAVLGSGITTVPCASGAVNWTATVDSMDPWTANWPLSISALMKDDNGGMAHAAGGW